MMRYAVILTHNRPELLGQTVMAIKGQVDCVIIIDNASWPPVDLSSSWADDAYVTALHIPDQPPNLSELWCRGLDYATHSGEVCRVAFLCDDAPPPPDWFDAVTGAMAETGAAVGASHHAGFAGPPILKTAPDSDLWNRMPGWAWILAPESGVRPDPTFRWWWGDTDVDWQARGAGGMVMIGTHPVPNIRPNDFTASRPELGVQCGRDGEAFATKWGSRPWL